MENVLAKCKERKKNGGFTLVELIIVIAIMAALVAVLAPQYIKYVDKSRKTADASTADSILSACRVAATEDSITKDFTVTWTNNDTGADELEITKGSTADLVDELEQSLSISFTTTTGTGTSTGAATLPAKVTPDSTEKYVVSYDASTGSVQVSSSDNGWWD